jgi:hypothetical protein
MSAATGRIGFFAADGDALAVVFETVGFTAARDPGSAAGTLSSCAATAASADAIMLDTSFSSYAAVHYGPRDAAYAGPARRPSDRLR